MHDFPTLSLVKTMVLIRTIRPQRTLYILNGSLRGEMVLQLDGEYVVYGSILNIFGNCFNTALKKVLPLLLMSNYCNNRTVLLVLFLKKRTIWNHIQIYFHQSEEPLKHVMVLKVTNVFTTLNDSGSI